MFNIRTDLTFTETALKAAGVHNITKDDLTRRICITPFAGAYGTAGYVCTIEGTPPLATFILSDYGRLLQIVGYHGVKTAYERHETASMKWLREYLNAHIRMQLMRGEPKQAFRLNDRGKQMLAGQQGVGDEVV